MILAAADYAEGKGPPPLPLRYALQAHSYHALPEAGGLRDQPARLLNQMALCYNVYTVWRDFRYTADKTKWKKENPDRWKIAVEVLKERGKRH